MTLGLATQDINPAVAIDAGGAEDKILLAARQWAAPVHLDRGDQPAKSLEERLGDLKNLTLLEHAVSLDGAGREIPGSDALRSAVRALHGFERISMNVAVRGLRQALEVELTSI